VAQVVIAEYGYHYTDLVVQKDFIISEIESEEKQFLTTLEKGLKEFEKLLKALQPSIQLSPTGGKSELQTEISGKQAFKLYDTYGFPIEITEDLALENNLTVDRE